MGNGEAAGIGQNTYSQGAYAGNGGANSDDALAHGKARRRRAGFDTQPGENPGDVGGDGAVADGKPVGNLLVGSPLGHMLEHLGSLVRRRLGGQRQYVIHPASRRNRRARARTRISRARPRVL